VLKNS